ncbi:MAG: hypothetical protein NTW21_01535 [Verrucomicrobia bacterium]|nr:hypothetical protein [Verrucomicrobiota bacterium]
MKLPTPSFLLALAVLVPSTCLVRSGEPGPIEAPTRLTLPPTLTAAGTTTAIGGLPWGYVVWNANTQDWFETHQVAVYLKPVAATTFALQGVMSMLTAPQAIQPWIERARKLGDDIPAAEFLAGQLYNQWCLKDALGNPLPTNPPLPAALEDRLSMVAQRALQVPSAANALRQMGNARPVFRFLTGTAWAGPLGVADGQEVVIELRERLRTTGVEGSVVGRVTLRAGYVEPLVAPGQAVQVPPLFPTALPVPAEEPFPIVADSRLPDLGVALRWAVPEALRRQLLLTRGFMVWRLPNPAGGGYVPANAAELDQLARQGKLPTAVGPVRALFRVPASASKIFRTPAGAAAGESGADIGDFTSDRTTWFATDDNSRFATDPAAPQHIVGSPYPEGDASRYYVAAVDLLGRFGALSPVGGGTAIHTLPPPVPEPVRVDNVMLDRQQRLRVFWKPNHNTADRVSTTHYLIYRDRVANQVPLLNGLERSSTPALQNELIYLGAVAQPATLPEVLSFDDVAITPTPADFGATYFYCIRAAHLGPMGYDTSAPSPAVFGTLRDRLGPAAPSGYLATDSPRVDIEFEPPMEQALGDTQAPTGMAMVRFEVERGSTRADPAGGRQRILQGVDWIEFGAKDARGRVISKPAVSPRLHFGEGDQVWYEMPVQVDGGKAATYYARAASSAGRLSHQVTLQTDTTLRPGQHYLLKVRVVAAPAIEMRPQVLIGDPIWVPFFHRGEEETVVAFTPQDAGSETLKGIFTGSADPDRSRTLLIQYQGVGSPSWKNHDTARLLPASTSFYFHSLPDFQAKSWRVWEIVDPSDAPDVAAGAHEARPAGADTTLPIQIVMHIPEGSREYRIYRRVDSGPLALLKQDAGFWTSGIVDQVMLADAMIPSAGATIGYYGQVFDEHGNPSPLALLGSKVATLPELPVPSLDPVVAGGTATAPTMKISIACPSPGVEYLELFVDPPVPASAGFQLVEQDTGEWFSLEPGVFGSPTVRFTKSLVTSHIVPLDPKEPVLVTTEIPVETGLKYTVTVRSLGPRLYPGTLNLSRQASNRSVTRNCTWVPPLGADLVPWPTKPVPPLITLHPLIAAFRTGSTGPATYTNMFAPGYFEGAHSPEQYPVAIRIGRIPFDSNWTVRGTRISDTIVIGYLGISGIPGFDASSPKPALLKTFLFPAAAGSAVPASLTSPLPFVLYRQQTARLIEGVTVATYGTDIIQASPLINSISWTPETGADPQFALFIDPFVGAAMLEPDRLPLGADLCLFDNSPVAAGATYHYYLVHFGPTGEPDAIIDAKSLTFPEVFDNNPQQ